MRTHLYRSILAAPMLVNGVAVGVVNLLGPSPFANTQLSREKATQRPFQKAIQRGAGPTKPKYARFDPQGNFICPDFNGKGCRKEECAYKRDNAVHCCDVWGCFQKHPRYDH